MVSRSLLDLQTASSRALPELLQRGTAPMNLHFNLPWAGRASVDSILKAHLDAQSIIELDQAAQKLPSLARAPAPETLSDNGFSFPPAVQTSPLKLFPSKNSQRTHSSDDSRPVSNSSASISDGFGTSSDEEEVTLSAPRRAAPLLRPPAPRLTPLLSTTDSPLGAPSAPQRLEAAALVAALGRHSLQLRAALVILGYQDLWTSEHESHRSIEGILAGVLALARRAGAQPLELTPHFLLTLLWLLHAFDSQVGGWASDVAYRFTALLPRDERAAARTALHQGLLNLQGPLLERCGWRVRLTVGEVGAALAELRGCLGFQPWCAVAHLELLNLLKKRPPRMQSHVVELPLSKFEAGDSGPDEAALAPAAQYLPSVSLGPSALLGAQSTAIALFPPGLPLQSLQAAARDEDGARADGRQPWRKRLRGVDGAASEPPNKQAQRASMASRFHTALRGMFAGGGGGGGRAPGHDPLPGDFAGTYGGRQIIFEE